MPEPHLPHVLELRFFVTHMTVRAHTSFTAMAGDGTTLGRVERPKPPAPRTS